MNSKHLTGTVSTLVEKGKNNKTQPLKTMIILKLFFIDRALITTCSTWPETCFSLMMIEKFKLEGRIWTLLQTNRQKNSSQNVKKKRKL